MTNSDIIAITAIIVSGIISLATLIASYYTNRANYNAELRKIAYEKQIVALQELFILIGKSSTAMNTYCASVEEFNKDSNPETEKAMNYYEEALFKQVVTIVDHFSYVRIILPNGAEKYINAFLDSMLSLKDDNTVNNVNNWRNSVVKSEGALLSKIRQSLNLK